jgi:hypothetical protein
MKFALIGAAAVAVTAFATPALAAPPVVSDPGRCAQFYPDANCQNFGSGNPYTDGGWQNWNATDRAHRYRGGPKMND